MNHLSQFGTQQKKAIQDYVKSEIERNLSVHSTRSIITDDFKMDGFKVTIDGEEIKGIKSMRTRFPRVVIIDKFLIDEKGNYLELDKDLAIERLIVTVSTP